MFVCRARTATIAEAAHPVYDALGPNVRMAACGRRVRFRFARAETNDVSARDFIVRWHIEEVVVSRAAGDGDEGRKHGPSILALVS
jgi:hypothetical protein